MTAPRLEGAGASVLLGLVLAVVPYLVHGQQVPTTCSPPAYNNPAGPDGTVTDPVLEIEVDVQGVFNPDEQYPRTQQD